MIFKSKLIAPILLAFVLVVSMFLFFRFCISKNVDYRPGDIVLDISFKSKGKNINIEEGKWNLLFVINDVIKNQSFLKYLNYLNSVKYKNNDLNIIVFSHSENLLKGPINQKINNDLTPLSIKENYKTVKAMFNNFETSTRSIAIIDTNKTVKFNASFVTEDDLRQLLEKFIKEKIEYSKLKPKLKIGDVFPEIRILNIQDNSESTVHKSNNHLWFVFTSKCVSCVLNSNLLTFSILENSRLKKLNIPISLLFSPYFSLEEVKEKVKEFGIKNSVYMAMGELLHLEDLYFKNSETEIFVIALNNINRVIYIQPFSKFIFQINRGDIEYYKTFNN